MTKMFVRICNCSVLFRSPIFEIISNAVAEIYVMLANGSTNENPKSVINEKQRENPHHDLQDTHAPSSI